MKPAEIEHQTSTETSGSRIWLFEDPELGFRVAQYTLTNELFLGLGKTKWFLSALKHKFFNRPSVYILLECNSNIQILQIVVHINYYIYLSEKSSVPLLRKNVSTDLTH